MARPPPCPPPPLALTPPPSPSCAATGDLPARTRRPASMASWATVARAAPHPREAGGVAVQPAVAASSTAVVDANAVIAGIPPDVRAQRMVTVKEVMAELRDRKTRDALAGLPFAIEVMEPSESGLAAGRAKGWQGLN